MVDPGVSSCEYAFTTSSANVEGLVCKLAMIDVGIPYGCSCPSTSIVKLIAKALKSIAIFDIEATLKGGPWTFDSHLCIIERVKLSVQIKNIPLFHVDFWVQVHNFPAGLVLEKVGRVMANFNGSFVEYNKYNNYNFW